MTRITTLMLLLIWVHPRSSAAVDYSKFSHATPKHQAACITCHKIPTKDWTNVSAFPDITDYPGHDACVSCHRRQFFRGAKPPICSVCHSKTSPRYDVRFTFGNPATKRQFTIEFPHDKHQDVIALLRFAHPPQNYNNCTICHASRTVTFKTAPTDHSSCFDCHWKSQAPAADDCNGCHKPATTPYVTTELPSRISSKFMHEGGGERKQHVAECTSCHINITKAASLRGLKPDVPITACTECHNKAGSREDLNKELAAIDKNRAFVCIYCHAENIGSRDAPASHYLIAERPPITRKDIK
jgi:predicted CXXCH cytochrome family protein